MPFDPIFIRGKRVVPNSFERHDVSLCFDGPPVGTVPPAARAYPERVFATGQRIRTGTASSSGAQSDLSALFGGYNPSGTGREFGAAGIDRYVEHRMIHRAIHRAMSA